MKKSVYMAPAITIINVKLRTMMAGSITSVEGDSGITMGNGETPTSADSRRNYYYWDDEEE